MYYHLLRLSLVPRNQASLFGNGETDRAQILTRLFSSEIRFLHRRRPFAYIPISGSSPAEGVLAGRIGRPAPELAYLPPDQQLEEYYEERWRAADFILRVSGSRGDDQVLAIEFSSQIGQPLAIASSLADYINMIGDASPYDLFVNPIGSKKEFWSVMEQHSGSTLSTLTFRLTAPNVLKAQGTIQDAMAAYAADENSEVVTTILHNQNGKLNAHTDGVRAAADYALSGGGEIDAKNGRVPIYSSKEQVKTIPVDRKDNRTILQRVKALLPKLSREE